MSGLTRARDGVDGRQPTSGKSALDHSQQDRRVKTKDTDLKSKLGLLG